MGRSGGLVVLGSVVFSSRVVLERLPSAGETMAAVSSAPDIVGGKGSIQSACAARLGCLTNLIAQVGKDSYAGVIKEELSCVGVRLDHLHSVNVATGHAFVMASSGSSSSTTSVLVPGANISWPRLDGGFSRLPPASQLLIRHAGALLLQREVSDCVNIEAAKIAKSSAVPVILDVIASVSPVPVELLKCVTVLSTTRKELGQLVGSAVCNKEDAVIAARAFQASMGIKQVLVKDEQFLLLLLDDGEQSTYDASTQEAEVDGDLITASYAVAFVERQQPAAALRFAAAAGRVDRGRSGLSKIPDRKEVQKLLLSVVERV